MNEYVEYQGDSYDEIEQLLLLYFKNDQIIDFLELCSNENTILDSDEIYSQTTKRVENSGYNKIIPTTTYSLKIKKSTLLLVGIFFETLVQSHLHGTSMDSIGVPIIPSLIELKNCFYKLSEENGEFCVAIECSKKGSRIRAFSNFNPNNECFNNHFHCTFNSSGICTMNNSIFDKIISKLIDNKVIIQKDNFYKISF